MSVTGNFSEDQSDYRTFAADLEDGETARDFLLHIKALGYTIDLPPMIEVQFLSDCLASEVAIRHWAIVYLSEYDFGDSVQ